MKKKTNIEITFDESLEDEWSHDFGIVEVPLRNGTFYGVGAVMLFVALAVAARLLVIGPFAYSYAEKKANNNLYLKEFDTAPRGRITDRYGKILAENSPGYVLYADIDKLKSGGNEEKLKSFLSDTLGMPQNGIENLIEDGVSKKKQAVVLYDGLDESQIVKIQALGDPALKVISGFRRDYVYGAAFSHVLGYTGRVLAEDLKADPGLWDQTVTGRDGVELYYDSYLRGKPGYSILIRNAKGQALSDSEYHASVPGNDLRLTIDADLQKYFADRLAEGLRQLGRDSGVGIAINPQTGEILSLVSLPGYDDNVLSGPGKNDQKKEILNAPFDPMFDRAVGGYYNPGSTIKPLVAVAALKEGVITPDRSIYSPGYLDLPNPFDPKKPTRFLDWRPQGYVNVITALAQSSNVYFYEVGGGFGDIKGLGINRLLEWWKKFGLGKPTGIDLPGEASGRFPNPDDAMQTKGRPWLIGDTYNVSIGQADLLVTPIQLISYISAVANGGFLYRPYLAEDLSKPQLAANLSDLGLQIRYAQRGMEAGVTSPLGTSHLLADLPIKIAAKTGTAQIQNKTAENAFFVGYAPADNPRIAILVLVEHSREGSLNAVPIAKDVFEWYYEHRIKNPPPQVSSSAGQSEISSPGTTAATGSIESTPADIPKNSSASIPENN